MLTPRHSYRYHIRNIRNQDKWKWLWNGTLKCETESLIFAAQEQAIQTNITEGNIHKLQEQAKCRICSRDEETTNQTVSECPNLVRKSIKESMIGSEGKFIGKFVEQMESMLNQNGMSIKQKHYRQTIL